MRVISSKTRLLSFELSLVGATLLAGAFSLKVRDTFLVECGSAANLGTLQMQVLGRLAKGRLCLCRYAARAAACQVLHKRILVCLQASVAWQNTTLGRVALTTKLGHVGFLTGGVLVRYDRLLVLLALGLLLLVEKCQFLIFKPLLKRAIFATVMLLALRLCHMRALERSYMILFASQALRLVGHFLAMHFGRELEGLTLPVT